MDENKIEKAIGDVEVFIQHFDSPFGEIQSKFLYGQCFWFAKILEVRFKPFYLTDIVYDPVANHFYFSIEIGKHYLLFDVSGLKYSVIDSLPEPLVFWHKYIMYEPLDAARVYRDCIWQLDQNQWSALSEDIRDRPWHF